MTDPWLRRALLSRRAFVAGSAAGAAAALPLVRARAGDAEDLAAAARLLGLELTEAEREQAAGRAEMHRGQFEALREHAVPIGVPPAVRFRPALRGDRGDGARLDLPEVPELATDEDLAFANVHQLAALLRAKRVTSRRLTELSLARLERFDPKLMCVVTLLREHALALADRADRELADGRDRGPLHGIPFGAKDLLSHPGAPTTYGATPFRDQVLDQEATVLARLREAGAVLVAKLSLGALAMGDVWFGGKTRNPWNTEQGSSGSSAGSAAAVTAGLVPFAIGSETLGSIVSPCSRCGATGLRPTFGAVGRGGAMPLSWTMDKLGPITRSAADAALVFDAIRGADPLDPDAVDGPFSWRRGGSLEGTRIGYVESRQWERPDETRFLETLRGGGAELVPLTLPDYPYRSLLLVLFTEGAAVFDDLTRRGGLRELVSQGDGDWPNLFRAARFVPAVEHLRALRIRTRLMTDMEQAIAGLDAFVSPPFGGPTLVCTNLTGHPCCVLPLGFRDNGTPTSITICGPLFGESAVLRVAETWQRETDWHLRRPPLE